MVVSRGNNLVITQDAAPKMHAGGGQETIIITNHGLILWYFWFVIDSLSHILDIALAITVLVLEYDH